MKPVLNCICFFQAAISAFCLFAVLEPNRAFAAPPATSVSGVKIDVLPASAELLPIEPLDIMLTVQNVTDKATATVGSWEVFIQYRRDKDSKEKWRIYHPDRTPLPVPQPPTSLTLLSGEKKTIFRTIAYNSDGQPVFRDVGVYHVKISYGPLESDIITVKVVEPKSVGAVSFLRKTEIPRFFSLEASRVANPDSVQAEIQTFLKEFPASEYVPQVTIAQALTKLREGGAEQVLAAAEILKNFPDKQDPRRMRAKLYLAHCFDILKNRTSRIATLQELSEQTADPVASQHAKEMLTSIKD